MNPSQEKRCCCAEPWTDSGMQKGERTSDCQNCGLPIHERASWMEEFDDRFDIWKAEDHGSTLENFPENHLNLAMNVKSFISALLISEREKWEKESKSPADMEGQNLLPYKN